MQLSYITILLSFLLMAGCSSNTNQALYESIKTQNEAYKTPAERAASPAPSYKDYQSERDKLKH